MKRISFFIVPVAMLVPLSAQAQEPFGGGNVVEQRPSASPPPPPPSPPPASTLSPTPLDEAAVLRPKKPVALRLDGGYAQRRLFDLGVTGVDLGLALGAQTSRHAAWWGTTRLSLGDTNNGLSVWSSRWGAEVEGVFDPVRFGIGVSLLAMGVSRAARHETLHAFGAEARTFIRVDVLRNDDVALFLRAGVDAGLEASGGTIFWGPAIGLGGELGLSGKRPAAWQ